MKRSSVRLLAAVFVVACLAGTALGGHGLEDHGVGKKTRGHKGGALRAARANEGKKSGESSGKSGTARSTGLRQGRGFQLPSEPWWNGYMESQKAYEKNYRDAFNPPSQMIPSKPTEHGGGSHGAQWVNKGEVDQAFWKPAGGRKYNRATDQYWHGDEAEMCATNLATFLTYGRGPRVARMALGALGSDRWKSGLTVEPMPLQNLDDLGKSMGDGVNAFGIPPNVPESDRRYKYAYLNPRKLSFQQAVELVALMFADHVVGNYDALSQNIGSLTDEWHHLSKGTIVGFDKGAAFRFVEGKECKIPGKESTPLLDPDDFGYMMVYAEPASNKNFLFKSAYQLGDGCTLDGFNPWIVFDPCTRCNPKRGKYDKLPVNGPLLEALFAGELYFSAIDVFSHPLVVSVVHRVVSLDLETVREFTREFAEKSYGEDAEVFYQSIVDRARNLKGTKNSEMRALPRVDAALRGFDLAIEEILSRIAEDSMAVEDDPVTDDNPVTDDTP